MPTAPSAPLRAASVTLIALAALTIRVYRLDTFAFRGDESFTVQFSSLPAGELWEGIRSVEPNPPLYYYALRGWMALTGQSEYAARYFSVLFGVLCVPLTYALGRALGGRRLGLVAAGLLAVNPFQIFHSQDVRNYTLWPAIVLAEWWFLWAALQRGRARHWVGYAVFALLGLYTHYYHLFVVAAENVFVVSLLLRYPGVRYEGIRWEGVKRPPAYAGARRRLLAVWVAVQAALGIGLAVWLLAGSTRAIEEIYSGASPSPLELVTDTLAAFSVGETVPRQTALWLAAPAAALMVVGAVSLLRSLRLPSGQASPGAARLLLIGVAVPLLCVFLVSLARPLFRPRYLNMTAPAYYLLAAQGALSVSLATRPRWRAIGMAAAAAWLIAGTYSHAQALFNPRFAKSPDWRARAAYFESGQRPGDVIVQNYPDPSLGFYYRGEAPLLIVPTGYLDNARRAETEQTLRDLLDRYDRIWLLPLTSAAWDYDGAVERRLARSADRVWSGQVAGLDTQLYETPHVFAARIRPLDCPFDCTPGKAPGGHVDFEHDIRLLGYRVAAERLTPGDSLRLVLYWQAHGPVGADYTVFTHLLDASGVLRGQQDNPPVGGTYLTSQWRRAEIVVDAYEIAIPSDLPPGAYKLEVGLYDWLTQTRLVTAGGDDRVVLPVTIEVTSE